MFVLWLCGIRKRTSHIVRPYSPIFLLAVDSPLVYSADLKATFQLQILGVKKNPQSPMYTQLGVLTKGTVIEVNVSELGMVTAGGKVVFGKYAQVTNNPENDGCINAVLRTSSPSLILRRALLTCRSQLSELPFRGSYPSFSYCTTVSVNPHRCWMLLHYEHRLRPNSTVSNSARQIRPPSSTRL